MAYIFSPVASAFAVRIGAAELVHRPCSTRRP